MSNKIYILKEYIKYSWHSQTRYSLHSPFLFDLTEKALRSKQREPLIDIIENIRTQLLKNNTTIEVLDLGAGSKSIPSSKRKICAIARTSLKPPKQAHLLYQLVNYFKPTTILELGTSLGISTMYMATANKQARVLTLEGADAIATIAEQNFKTAELTNIELIRGNFDNTLQPILSKLNTVDLVYFDGNHRMEPTLNYFNQCVAKAHNNSVFIFDDVHWSPEMTQAWKTIKKHPSVTVTLDIFQFGLVFFRKEQAKQDFILRF